MKFKEFVNRDTVNMDIPLFIRVIEFCRETAKTDKQLHDLTEKAIALGKRGKKVLTMAQYTELLPKS